MADQGKLPAGTTPRRVLSANLLALAGIALLARGLWMISPAVSLVTIGSLMLVAGVIARIR
jgi:hypothetical protein